MTPPLPKLALPRLSPQHSQILAVALTLALVPVLAHAQTADSIVQWFVTTYARGLINAGIIVGANRDAPLAVVGSGFAYANLLGALGLAGLTALLYGWLMRRAR